MEKAAMDEIYISIRPYLDDAQAIRSFMENTLDLGTGALLDKVRSRIENSSSTERTDFQILLNALEKHVVHQG
ncbi:MAG TPA: hypothetical protein PK718_00830 [Candidatus Methanofastidiosa archaeon]|nr:hypothetical protein [Candidatus Methanofastidiosa archaeon]HPR41078.1 hypothetical protein [Candidatus Methanofastidiosa archaeon]